MVFVPVAPWADNHSIKLAFIVVLRQRKVWPLSYLIFVVDNRHRPPVVGVPFLLPRFPQWSKYRRYLLFA